MTWWPRSRSRTVAVDGATEARDARSERANRRIVSLRWPTAAMLVIDDGSSLSKPSSVERADKFPGLRLQT